MTRVLLPPWRAAVSLPGVRIAAVLAVVGPAFVVGWGKESDTALRLLLAGMAAGVALALVWDDRCAPVTAATPVGLPAVRRGRAALVVVTLGVGWGACALVAERAVPDVPVAATAVPVLALSALLLASVGLIARGRDGEPIAAYPVPVLLLLLLLLSRLPERWSLLVTPAGPGWSQARDRWLLLLGASVIVAIWMLRDPAERPVLAVVRTRTRRAS